MCDVEMVEKESDRVSDQEQAGEFEEKKRETENNDNNTRIIANKQIKRISSWVDIF